MLIAVATPWAATLAFFGLLLGFGVTDLLPLAFQPMPAGVRLVLGMTAVAGGHLVFMCLVADRLFPLASKRVVWWAELSTCAVMFAGMGWLLVNAALAPVGGG